MTPVEIVMDTIRKEAVRSGDVILHLWEMDLQDGTSNVKAIIRTKEGKVVTVGARIGTQVL